MKNTLLSYSLLLFGLLVLSTTTAFAQSDRPAGYGSKENHTVVVNREAEYPGGDQELFMDVYEKAPFSAEARQARVEGQVNVKFIIQADGSVTDVLILKDTKPACGPAIKEYLESKVRFEPAIEDGKPVPRERLMGFPVRVQ